MARVKSKLSGFEEFDYLLRNLGPRVGNNVLQRAVSSAMRLGKKAVLKRVPRSAEKRSRASKTYGFAHENIRLIRLKRNPNRGTKSARVDTGDAFWLVFYHFGTRYQPARPFFTQAIEGAREAIINALGEALKKGIEKEALKLRKVKK